MAELYSRRSFLAGALTAGMLSTSATYLFTRHESITLTLATGTDTSRGGRRQLITMWNELNPDTRIVPQEINSSTQDQFDKFDQSSADIFNLDLIHIPRFAAEGRIAAFDPGNGISLLPPIERACRGGGSYWAAPWNADVGMLFRRVPDAAQPGPDPTLKGIVAGPAGQFVGQLNSVGSQTDEAFVINVLEHALAQDDTILDDHGTVSTSEGQWRAALAPLAAAMRAKKVVAASGEADTLRDFQRNGRRYMRNWPVYWSGVDQEERGAHGTAEVLLAAMPTGILGGQALAISADCRHRREAIRAIHYLTDTPAQMLLATYGFAPTGIDAYIDDQLTEMMPELATIRTAVERSRPRPMHRNYAAFAAAFKDHTYRYLYQGEDLTGRFVDDLQEALK